MLIKIHGGPEGQAQPFFSGTTQFYLNELGLAVIVPNVRGSSGYGKTYLKLDNAEQREDSVKDIGALLDWIAQQPELDARASRFPAGRTAATWCWRRWSNSATGSKPASTSSASANFITFLNKHGRLPARSAAGRIRRRARSRRCRRSSSRSAPPTTPTRSSRPCLVAHGRNDPRVPFSEAEQIAAKVRSHGRPVWTVFADNEGHGFAKKDNADYMRAVEAYFLKQNLGIEK